MRELDFEDGEQAFRGRSTRDLETARWVFQVMGRPVLSWVASQSASWALALRLPWVERTIKNSIFRIFCGGIDLEETCRTARKLEAEGVQTIFDYAVEAAPTESGRDLVAEQLIALVDRVATNSSASYLALKATAIMSFGAMEHVRSGSSLSPEHQREMDQGRARLDAIVFAAAQAGVSIFIDAEESWIQDCIDREAERLMVEFNKGRVIVYTTIQMYRRDRADYLARLIRETGGSGHQGASDHHLGIKLVRGAYMAKERERAERLGYENPIHPTKEATDLAYDAALGLCLAHLDCVAVCVATHNSESTQAAVELMRGQGIDPSNERVSFAQLLGMADRISFPLAAHGYRVLKYVPYGDVRDVFPYLLRRAEENDSVAQQSSGEVARIDRELRRRRQEI